MSRECIVFQPGVPARFTALPAPRHLKLCAEHSRQRKGGYIVRCHPGWCVPLQHTPGSILRRKSMNIDFERFVKIAQSLSFTTFLILSVTAMSYAMLHLYTDTRTDWGQVQVNAQNIGQMSTNVEELVSKIDS